MNLVRAIHDSRYTDYEANSFERIWAYYGAPGFTWIFFIGVKLFDLWKSLGRQGFASRDAVHAAEHVQQDTDLFGLYFDCGSEDDPKHTYMGSSVAMTQKKLPDSERHVRGLAWRVLG